MQRTRTTLLQPHTPLQSFQGAWISDRDFRPAARFPPFLRRGGSHGVANATPLSFLSFSLSSSFSATRVIYAPLLLIFHRLPPPNTSLLAITALFFFPFPSFPFFLPLFFKLSISQPGGGQLSLHPPPLSLHHRLEAALYGALLPFLLCYLFPSFLPSFLPSSRRRVLFRIEFLERGDERLLELR